MLWDGANLLFFSNFHPLASIDDSWLETVIMRVAKWFSNYTISSNFTSRRSAVRESLWLILNSLSLRTPTFGSQEEQILVTCLNVPEYIHWVLTGCWLWRLPQFPLCTGRFQPENPSAGQPCPELAGRDRGLSWAWSCWVAPTTTMDLSVLPALAEKWDPREALLHLTPFHISSPSQDGKNGPSGTEQTCQ